MTWREREQEWKQSPKILDVGCGSNPEGTHNLDLYVGETPHHKHNINPEKLPNFKQGNAENLPYEDDEFDLTILSHVLEHTENPMEVIKELYRVSSRAIIRVPNNPTMKEHPEHLYSWSKTSLRNLLLKTWESVGVYTDTRLNYVSDSRLFNALQRIPTIGQAVSRVVGRMLELELIAFCEKDSGCD